ncbi:MAG TPA: DUF1566 domain-containing protein, partial [Epsilonproteobacteria bacterium]|nr:DUF1566 domain-containing protein [Campylobacterota bacterium]
TETAADGWKDVNPLNTIPGAMGYCEYWLGEGWRLPNINELYSLADRSQEKGISDVFKTGKSGVNYWSSTTVADFPTKAWTVQFGNGTIAADHSFAKTVTSNYVRCVRDAK